MTEREAGRTFALAYLRRLVHLGRAGVLLAAAAAGAPQDAMAADGLSTTAPRDLPALLGADRRG